MMTMGKARVSCSEGANDGDNEKFDDVEPMDDASQACASLLLPIRNREY